MTKDDMPSAEATDNDDFLVIGIGNEYRDDDALGILAVRELRRREIPDLRVLEMEGEGAALIEAWRGAERVIIVDAIKSGDVPGTIHRLDIPPDQIPRRFLHNSSHEFGAAEAIDLARNLRCLPRRLILYGIEGLQFGTGVGLSDPVIKAIPELLTMIEGDLRAIHAS
jgi:hydrogenase maturation protease